MTAPADLPPVRHANDADLAAGRVCQSCRHWTRDDTSYVRGTCALDPARPRQTNELMVCDAFDPEDSR